MTAVVFEKVRKTFGATVALEAFDLTMHAGELVSLLGPSGCGKTTALRIAAGFERGDSGTVSVNEVDLTNRPAHKRNTGMVFQSYSLFPNLSVADNVDFGLRTRKVEKAERRRRVHETLELVQLGDLAPRFPHQLSGGQQQRVALARALAIRPEVLLLDEPLSALDAKVRGTLRDEIRRIQSELKITTLFVTHDQEEALAISDRVGVMSNGRLEQIGTPVEVYRHPANAFVARFVGSMNELPGTVAGPSAIRIGELIVPVSTIVSRTQLATGTSVNVLVRPEDLSLGAEPKSFLGALGVMGTVTSLSFQGAASLVGVQLEQQARLVSVLLSGSTSHPTLGDKVQVVIDAKHAVCELSG